MLLLGLDPVCQLGCLSDELVGFAGLAQSLGSLLTKGEDVGVKLLDLGLASSDRAAVDQLLLGG